MAKTRLDDKAIKALKLALRTKLGVSKPKAAKNAAKVEEPEEEEAPAPKAKKVERYNYTDL